VVDGRLSNRNGEAEEFAELEGVADGLLELSAPVFKVCIFCSPGADRGWLVG
jgi:hypothetical protein